MVSQSRQARTAQARAGSVANSAANSVAAVPLAEQLKSKAAELGRAVNVVKAALANGASWDALSETCSQKKYTDLYPLFQTLLEFSSSDMATVDMQVWRKTASLLDKTAKLPLTDATLAEMVKRFKQLDGPAYMKPSLLAWMESLKLDAPTSNVEPQPVPEVSKPNPVNVLAKAGVLKPKAVPPATAKPNSAQAVDTVKPSLPSESASTRVNTDSEPPKVPQVSVVLGSTMPSDSVIEIPEPVLVNDVVSTSTAHEVDPIIELVVNTVQPEPVVVAVEEESVDLDVLSTFESNAPTTIKTLHADPIFKLVPLTELLSEEISKFQEGASVQHMVPHLAVLLEEQNAISGVDALCLFNAGHVAAAWVPFNAIKEVQNPTVVIQGSKLKHMLAGVDRSLGTLRNLTANITRDYTLVDIQLALHPRVLEKIKRHGLPESLIKGLIAMADGTQEKFLGNAIPDISQLFALEQLNKQYGEAGLNEEDSLLQAKSALATVRETAQAMQTNKDTVA